MSVPAFPGSAVAQYGIAGAALGMMMSQSMQPPRDYYQPSPPPPQYQPQYQQGYQQPPYQRQYQPPPYQQQQSDRYLQNEENEQLRRANGVTAHAVKKQKTHKAVAAAPAPAPDGVIAVKMKKTGGTFEVPVRINNAVTLDFTVDSGAADVMIPANVVSALIKSGTLKQEDYVGGQTFTLADGSKLPSVRFKLASLRVGDQTLTDVVASVAPAAGSALLGQSFLSRFASWTLDNTAGTLNLTTRNGGDLKAAAASIQSGATDPAPAATSAAAAAAPTQPLDATKPAPPEVAPDKVAAVSAAPDPSAATGGHAGFELPAFPGQTSYADARARLMALGYEPQERQPCGLNDKACFPERVSCFGSDVIQCKFEWTHGDTAILVQTVNYPPTVANVECEKNCR
ncbi:MAG TPA: retropepsin-like aspartic protease [Stellaceae bacterium]